MRRQMTQRKRALRKGMLRKTAIAVVMMLSVGMECRGQAVEFPTIDLYDSDVMNMYSQAYAGTIATRMNTYRTYADLAINAYGRNELTTALNYANGALETGLDNGTMLYCRGLIYEAMEQYRYALKDYKKAKSSGIREAGIAYDQLKRKLEIIDKK